jgi:drug/metabolite transporter (DMT)-like permease
MKASVFINFVPISAIVLAFLMLREPVTSSLVIGAALVIMGVYITMPRTWSSGLARRCCIW